MINFSPIPSKMSTLSLQHSNSQTVNLYLSVYQLFIDIKIKFILKKSVGGRWMVLVCVGVLEQKFRIYALLLPIDFFLPMIYSINLVINILKILK